MKLLLPAIRLRHVSDITSEMLRERKIEALILDIDNTLMPYSSTVIDGKALDWLKTLKSGGTRIVLVSNNKKKRVLSFAKKLGLPYVSMAMKPLTRAFRKTSKKFGLPARSIAVVGDQVFTDILGGNLFGALTILVEPLQEEGGPFFKIKRKAEALVLKQRK